MRSRTARAVYLTQVPGYRYLRVLILTRVLRPLAAQAHVNVLEFTVKREHVAVAVRYSCTAVLDWYGFFLTCV